MLGARHQNGVIEMTTILVWNNQMGVHMNRYPGHASMMIGNSWNDREGKNFVSWIPDTDDPKGGIFGRGNLTLLADLQFEGYAPDHIIEMPDSLDQGRMLAEWTKIRNKANAHYDIHRKNCSTILARVLAAAGAKAGFLASHNLIWTPLKVKRLAMDMGGSEKTWASLLIEARAAGYLTNSERELLLKLYKRDARHGAAATENGAYYAGGKRIAPKEPLMLGRHGFKVNMGVEGRQGFFVEGGGMMGGTTRLNGGIMGMRQTPPA